MRGSQAARLVAYERRTSRLVRHDIYQALRSSVTFWRVRHAQLIDDLVSAARPALADLVVTATLRGISVEQLAIVLERNFEGKVSFRFGLRTDLITVAADRRLLATARNSIAKALLQRESDVPVIVLIVMEGCVAGGVRHLRTRLPS